MRQPYPAWAGVSTAMLGVCEAEADPGCAVPLAGRAVRAVPSSVVQVGDVIAGRFELVSIAGEGGMGVVFRAYDRETGREVAIKTLTVAGTSELWRFEREARILRALSHPGVVRHVSDGVSDAGAPWLAMEWVEGEDLRNRLRRGPLELDEAIALGIELCESLTALHDAGVIHRDLKPGNVRLVEGGTRRSKLLDFGLVHGFEGEDEPRTAAGLVLGTPGYISPERARGDSFDARSDLFSLGAVLYACVSGVPPFRGATAVATLAKVVLEDPVPLRARCPRCPASLARLLESLLEKDPSRRPASAEEVFHGLHALSGRCRTELEHATGVLEGREQRFTCVLMVCLTDPVAPEEPFTLADQRQETSHSPWVLEVLCRGAQLETLRDGTKVFAWSGEDNASDIARRAAGAALALARLYGDGAKALASGRASVDEARPVGEAVDRAATLLAEMRSRSASARGRSLASPVFVDENVARLVEDRFEVRSEGGRRWLVGERTGPAGARTLLGRATPCVGREIELSVLDLTLSAVLDEGTAAAVVLTGEMGVGKSRVRQEWVR
ncbi:MAG: protein kinase domain-containing protein, partial [Deltaproteobacteria bacterium]